jgi:hypothetical protein
LLRRKRLVCYNCAEVRKGENNTSDNDHNNHRFPEGKLMNYKWLLRKKERPCRFSPLKYGSDTFSPWTVSLLQKKLEKGKVRMSG